MIIDSLTALPPWRTTPSAGTLAPGRAEESLEDIIRSADGSVFNNAAQVWNHNFFWNCMEPNGGGEPSGDLARLIRDSFGSFSEFKADFVAKGKGRFGSGYVWLVLDNSVLRCIATLNADNLLLGKQAPLLTCDVWEHTYYLGHRNDRGKYLTSTSSYGISSIGTSSLSN